MKTFKTIFKDKITKETFLIETTYKSKKKKKINGEKIRFVEIDVSSYSHPYFKGKKNTKKKTNERIKNFLKGFKKLI